MASRGVVRNQSFGGMSQRKRPESPKSEFGTARCLGAPAAEPQCWRWTMAFTRAEWTAAVTTACLSVTAATGARADEPESHEAPAQAVASPSAPASPDMPDTERPTRPTVDRSWLYLDDARFAEPGAAGRLGSGGCVERRRG